MNQRESYYEISETTDKKEALKITFYKSKYSIYTIHERLTDDLF